jgi:hypothetical protein
VNFKLLLTLFGVFAILFALLAWREKRERIELLQREAVREAARQPDATPPPPKRPSLPPAPDVVQPDWAALWREARSGRRFHLYLNFEAASYDGEVTVLLAEDSGPHHVMAEFPLANCGGEPAPNHIFGLSRYLKRFDHEPVRATLVVYGRGSPRLKSVEISYLD